MEVQNPLLLILKTEKGGHELRNTVGLQKLENAKKQSPLESPE